MSLQVFGCPSCRQPFQVEASQAGQKVRCPSCEEVVQIPETLATVNHPAGPTQVDDPAAAPGKPAEKPKPFPCPACKNVFGVLAAMYGTTMACPHCEKAVTITSPAKSKKPSIHPAAESRVPQSHVPETKQDADVPAIVVAPPEVAALNVDQSDDVRKDVDEENRETIVQAQLSTFVAQPVDHLLPPKFEALDPDYFYRRHRDGDQVLLPSADGSVQAVSNRIVTIVHNGKEYQLISSPRYRRIQNFIVNGLLLLIAALLLLAIYWSTT